MATRGGSDVTVPDAELSRVVSHALRHEPWLYQLEMDEEGWVPVEQLLVALQEKGRGWKSVDRDHLERVLLMAAKRRHELNGDRIRALYGHSLSGRVRKQAATPPARLFHGTTPKDWGLVAVAGLLPMGRQYVHLSVDHETASAVGQRKSGDPVILEVDAAAADSAGVVFYEGGELVWLADRIPASYIAVAL